MCITRVTYWVWVWVWWWGGVGVGVGVAVEVELAPDQRSAPAAHRPTRLD